MVDQARTVVVFPFQPKAATDNSTQLLLSAVEKARSFGAGCLVVEDGPQDRLALQNCTRLHLPINRGKIYAARHGFEFLRDKGGATFVAVADWDDEQDVAYIPAMQDAATTASADIVIGNRYGHFRPESLSEHRRVVNYLQSLVAKFLGYDVSDLSSGLVGCNWNFADVFIAQSRSSRLALGADWLILAFLNDFRVLQVPIGAKMRSDRTNGIKLADTCSIVLEYSHELKESGKADLVRFVEFVVQAFRRGEEHFSFPVGMIGGEISCTAIRRGRDYSLLFK